MRTARVEGTIRVGTRETLKTPDLPGLRSELVARFREGTKREWSDADFNQLALRIFRYQYGSVPLYGRFCDGRNHSPDTVDHWTEIPAVPTSAFKRFAFHARDQPVERVFRTSGTTEGPGTRGEHHVVELQLYEASLLTNFEDHVLVDVASPTVINLLPRPDEAPDSSLSWMMGRVADVFGGPGGGFYLHPDRGLDLRGLTEALAQAAARSRPVLVAGTAFAFAMWLEDTGGASVLLPEGSVVMETGGLKGRTRELSRAALHGALAERLGVPPARIIGEYGMTELLSQYYEPIREVAAGRRAFHGPPWLRARVLDPDSLVPVARGQPGILAHFDLANLHSVSSVLTEDLGERSGCGGFRLLGRAEGAEPRGCSLAAEEISRHAEPGSGARAAPPSSPRNPSGSDSTVESE